MKRGVVVVSSKATQMFLVDFLTQMVILNPIYQIHYHINTEHNNEYEIGGIKKGMRLFDEFVLLHDTCVVKTNTLFDLFFGYQGTSVSVSPNFLSYLGKFRTKTLLKLTIPNVHTKREAVDAESQFLREYISFEPNHIVLFPGFDEHYRWQAKHGRMNMVLENDYLIKYKATWHPSMIED
jgi:hypothetical protein